jgi:hypothetical protein
VRGFIQAARPSKSGKTLSVQIGGTWYNTKNFGLQQHVGKEIVGETSDSDYNGQTVHWLNSFTLVEGDSGPAPAPAAPNAPGATNGPKAPSHYQPMVSNLSAALIAAGKQPSDLRAWYVAAKQVLEDDPNVPF